jgi:hypothetical protein
MSLVANSHYQQYQVPRSDATALVEPNAALLLDSLGRTHFDAVDSELEFCGKALQVARRQARAEVVHKAIDFTRVYRDVPDQDWDFDHLPSIILSGHQPELFHPGVWFKNFLLARLAAESGAIAINFLVDNDLCRGSSIRVPTREPQHGYAAQNVLFDTPQDAVPWELRRLGSTECWQQFPSAVKEAIVPGLDKPLLEEIWPDATQAIHRTGRIGLAIAEARHKLEQRIGLQTLEVPLSHMVSTRAFARFSIQLLSELPRFQDVYNSQLHLYRAAHNIRSHAHPVPALEQEHGWLEAPWWIYRAEAPKRQRMWVRVLNEQLILSDRAGWQSVIEGRLDCDGAASQWLDLLADGICLRPRALLTTMYLRIMVSDLFLHGIGGGKYDQLTDAIIRDFFQIQPPTMAVATATLRLPLDNEDGKSFGEYADVESARSLQRERLWQLKHHADRFVADQSAEAQQLVERKHELLAHIPPRGEKWQWHREITAVNRRLSELAGQQRVEAKAELEQLVVQERQQRVLQSREYSFCLYPREFIAEHLQRMAN